jgi:hypothetical protein
MPDLPADDGTSGGVPEAPTPLPGADTLPTGKPAA